MSLRLLLPFNGNINTYGSDNLTMYLAGTGAPAKNDEVTYVDSKIGKGISFNYDINSALWNNTTDYYFTNNFAFSIWIYPKAVGGFVFTVGRADAGGYGYGIIVSSDNDILVWFGTSQIHVPCPLNDWTHITMNVLDNTAYVYVNGVLSNYQTPMTLPNYSDGAGIGIGCFRYNGGNIYPYNGYLCDFRIYDHCLSTKEIKEISKALIVHYPLNNQYETGQQNKYGGKLADGYIETGSFSRTKLTDEIGYNYKLTRTGDGNNSLPSLGSAHFSFTAGKTYFLSCKVRCHKLTSGAFRLRAARSSNDYVTNSVPICSPELADGKLHEYYVSQTINSTYNRSGSTVTCDPIFEIYADNQNGNGVLYDMDFDIKDIQIIESDNYVPFIQNEYTSNIVKDISGFNNNGIRTGSMLSVDNSARYNNCFNFYNSGYIIKEPFNVTTKAFTINFLVNPRGITVQHFIFGTFNNLTGNGFGILRDTGSDQTNYLSLIRSNSESAHGGDGITGMTLNALNMITFVYNGTTLKGYLNNNLSFNITYGSNGNVSHPVLMIGNSKFNNTPASENEEACISDFRFYATALSESDIKELYQNSVSVANNGTVMCYEIKESI